MRQEIANQMRWDLRTSTWNDLLQSPYLRFDRPCSLLITVGDQPFNNDTDLSLGAKDWVSYGCVVPPDDGFDLSATPFWLRAALFLPRLRRYTWTSCLPPLLSIFFLSQKLQPRLCSAVFFSADYCYAVDHVHGNKLPSGMEGEVLPNFICFVRILNKLPVGMDCEVLPVFSPHLALATPA